MMKIILQEDVPNLGVVGELVSVRDGYARNFLIPQGKAIFASTRSIAELQHQRRVADHRRKQATAEAEQAKNQIEGLAITLQAKVAPAQYDEDGNVVQESLPKLFGSITNRDLARVLRDSDVRVDHRRVMLEQPVRNAGKYEARIRLDGGIVARLTFWVMADTVEDVEAEKKRIEEVLQAKVAEEKAAREAAEAEAEAEAAAKARAEESQRAAAESDAEPAEEAAEQD